jgi:hypothetical protein
LGKVVKLGVELLMYDGDWEEKFRFSKDKNVELWDCGISA